VSEPDVTVVTVTYDAADLVGRCLDGLAAQVTDASVEVVVVDNASRDGTADLVAREHPSVRLVRSATNLGFAGGNDLVLDELRSRYVVLLNNDAVPDPGFVEALVRTLDAAPADVAGLAATVLLAARFRAARPGDDPADVVHGPDGAWVADDAGDVRLVNSTGNQVRTDGFGVDRGWLADAARHQPPPGVFGVSGAACILRTSALAEVGTFDRRFFMYYEDTDLSWRLRLAGYRFEHCPQAVVHHVHAASSGEGSAFFRFHDARNRLAMLTKNATGGLVARALVRYVLTTGSLAVRRRGSWPLVRTRVAALTSYAGLLPHLLRERRRIGRAAAVRRSDVERLLVTPQAAVGPYRVHG
jgi:N-acetylglucosaminyl-diphospho-decaprenol L-rhamnosyltransferase